jgi:hypothetical protein
MRPGKFVRAFARHGVLPLSPSDLTHCFPDMWKDPKVADNELSWLKKQPENSKLDMLFARIRLFFGAPLNATYRRKGQRGPLACALVRSDLSAARAVLEGMVGELREFHVERPPEPPGKSDAPDTAPPACRHCRGSQPPCPPRGTCCSPPCRQMSDRLMCSAWPA